MVFISQHTIIIKENCDQVDSSEFLFVEKDNVQMYKYLLHDYGVISSIFLFL